MFCTSFSSHPLLSYLNTHSFWSPCLPLTNTSISFLAGRYFNQLTVVTDEPTLNKWIKWDGCLPRRKRIVRTRDTASGLFTNITCKRGERSSGSKLFVPLIEKYKNRSKREEK